MMNETVKIGQLRRWNLGYRELFLVIDIRVYDCVIFENQRIVKGHSLDVILTLTELISN